MKDVLRFKYCLCFYVCGQSKPKLEALPPNVSFNGVNYGPKKF